MAEGEGFEPPVGMNLRLISRQDVIPPKALAINARRLLTWPSEPYMMPGGAQ